MSTENDWLLDRPKQNPPVDDPVDEYLGGKSSTVWTTSNPAWPTADYVRTQSTPMRPPAAPTASSAAAPSRINWTTLALACVVAFFVFRELRGHIPGPTPDDGQVVNVEGRHALILVDESESGQSKLTRDQAAAINSIQVEQAAEELGFDYQNYDVGEDLRTAAKAWKDLAAIAGPPPSLTIAIDGKATTHPITSKQQVIETIKRAAK